MRHAIAPDRVALKRAYDPAGATDGTRVLVDRLWPRGLTTSKAAVDLWSREIAPSPSLRKWFGHDPARWREFRRRYRAELDLHPGGIEQLRALARRGPITLVYAARDTAHSHALALREYLLERPVSTPAMASGTEGESGSSPAPEGGDARLRDHRRPPSRRVHRE